MSLIVQKFGGTSVGDIERIQRVAEKVAGFHAAGHEIVVVVSAMSGETNRLIELAHAVQERPLARELDLHWWIRSLLERLDQEGYENLIQRVSPGVERFLAAHDRDSMKANFWKLPFIQPLYIPQGLKLLLTSSAYPDLKPTLEG